MSSRQDKDFYSKAAPSLIVHIQELCSYLETCKNSSCKFYHPKWAVGVCYHNLTQKCTFSKQNCKRLHYTLVELQEDIEIDSWDIFYNTPFTFVIPPIEKVEIQTSIKGSGSYTDRPSYDAGKENYAGYGNKSQSFDDNEYQKPK